MKTMTIPDNELETSQVIQVFDYHNTQEISKQQIVLNKNTFSFLIEGTKEVHFDNSSLSVDNSEFLLMKSGHCLMTEKLSENQHYRSILLFFSNESLLNFIQKNQIKTTKVARHQSIFAFKHDEFIQNFIKSLIDISKFSGNVKSKLIELKFEEIMLYLSEKYGTDFLISLLVGSEDSIQKFTSTIESNALNKLTLKELAFLCNMSISTFKREFKKHYSESPIKWFLNKRLEYASYLMKQKHKSPSEVYFEIGYENLSSFIQAYKTKYGITPKQHQVE
ncbi:MAG: helix-turn-helix transcriptional regulator [Cytophagales bacterium]|nr:helix-turn-helix transcriptional regulator [Cytophagales bacterium]